MTRPPRRVFIGMIEVGGYYRALTAGLRTLGVEADNVDVAAHAFSYGALADRPRPIAAAEWVARHREGHRRAGRWWRFRAWTVVHRVWLLALLPWALVRYDAFVFGFGTTFVGTRDLWLLHLFRRRIVMVYHGTDVRPPYMDGADMDSRTGRDVADAITLTRRKIARIRRAERHATTIVSHPLYAQFFHRRSISYLAIGVPIPAPLNRPTATRAGSIGVRVLHAPSNPSVKGSARIRSAVDHVARTHDKLAYQEIAGRPNAEVLAAIEASDVIVDQAYSDLPFSIFGAEAAARERCVVVAGYGGQWIEQLLGGMPPVEWTLPEDLPAAIAGVVNDTARREDLARRGHEFLNGWQPVMVAERLLRVLRDDADEAWWYDPGEYAYPFGCGLPRERVSELVRSIVAIAGATALGVDHNPALRAALLAAAAEREPQPSSDLASAALDQQPVVSPPAP